MAVIQPSFLIVGGATSSGAGSNKPIEEVPQGPRNGVNRTFTLSHTPAAGYPILLFLNGDYQNRFTVEYTASGATITYAVAPEATDNHVIVYWLGSGGTLPNLRARSYLASNSTDQIDWGNSSVFNIHGDMALGVWVKFPSSAAGTIIERGFASAAMGDNLAFSLNPIGVSGSWDIVYAHDNGNTNANSQINRFVTAIPNDTWRYIGFTRDTTAMTVSLYMGVGTTISLVQTWTYVLQPDGGTNTHCLLLVGNSAGGSGSVGDQVSAPFTGTVEEHYIWTRKLTIAEHQAAMNGSPSTSSLVLGCASGNTPEQDLSTTGASGAVTGTTLVKGH